MLYIASGSSTDWAHGNGINFTTRLIIKKTSTNKQIGQTIKSQRVKNKRKTTNKQIVQHGAERHRPVRIPPTRWPDYSNLWGDLVGHFDMMKTCADPLNLIFSTQPPPLCHGLNVHKILVQYRPVTEHMHKHTDSTYDDFSFSRAFHMTVIRELVAATAAWNVFSC